MGNWLDSAISFFSPTWGFRRDQARTASKLAAQYGGAVTTRVSTSFPNPTQYQNAVERLLIPDYELQTIRNRAHHLVRNNPIADGILTRAVKNVAGQGFQLDVNSGNADWDKRAEDLMRDSKSMVMLSSYDWCFENYAFNDIYNRALDGWTNRISQTKTDAGECNTATTKSAYREEVLWLNPRARKMLVKFGTM